MFYFLFVLLTFYRKYSFYFDAFQKMGFSPQFYYPLTYNTTKRRQYRLAAMSVKFYQSLSLSHTQDTDRPDSFLRVRPKDTSVCEGGSDTVISGPAALTTSKPTNGCKDLCPCGPAATQQDRGDKKQDFAHSALFSNLQLHKKNHNHIMSQWHAK